MRIATKCIAGFEVFRTLGYSYFVKFETGILDWLFGEQVVVEIPDSGRGVRRIRVSKKWMQVQAGRGALNEIRYPQVVLFDFGPAGQTQKVVVVGSEVDERVYKALVDRKTRALYSVTAFVKGEHRTTLVTKELYEQTVAAIAQQRSVVDAAVHRAMGTGDEH